MMRCMLCGKERPDEELRGRVCRACADSVRREASGAKRKEKQASDRALRAEGQSPETSGDSG